MANKNILIIAFIFIFSHCFSQPGPPAPGCWPPPCVPVDGESVCLLFKPFIWLQVSF